MGDAKAAAAATAAPAADALPAANEESGTPRGSETSGTNGVPGKAKSRMSDAGKNVLAKVCSGRSNCCRAAPPAASAVCGQRTHARAHAARRACAARTCGAYARACMRSHGSVLVLSLPPVPAWFPRLVDTAAAPRAAK